MQSFHDTCVLILAKSHLHAVCVLISLLRVDPFQTTCVLILLKNHLHAVCVLISLLRVVLFQTTCALIYGEKQFPSTLCSYQFSTKEQLSRAHSHRCTLTQVRNNLHAQFDQNYKSFQTHGYIYSLRIHLFLMLTLTSAVLSLPGACVLVYVMLWFIF